MANIFDGLIIILAVVTIGSYIWSVKNHFKSEVLPSGAKLISFGVIASGIFLLLLTILLDQPVWAQILGALLQIGSLAIFWRTIKETRSKTFLAAFDEKNPQCLATTGPYHFVRHPFYTSYIVFWAGWTLAVWSLWALVPLMFMLVTYSIAARDEEAKFAKTDMAADYAAYKRKTGQFFPKII